MSSPHLPSVRPRQAPWIVWSVVPAILVVVAFGLWLRLTVTGPTVLDQEWLEFVGLTRGTVPYDLAVGLAEVGGGTGAIICTVVFAGAFALFKRLRAAGMLVVAMAIGVATSELLKLLFTRLRPVEQLYDSSGYSYPSGHSMGAAALALTLAFIAARSGMRRAGKPAAGMPLLKFHWTMILAFIWMGLMMWSRTALQVHWLTDTIAGTLIGISAAILADEIWTRISSHRQLSTRTDSNPHERTEHSQTP